MILPDGVASGARAAAGRQADRARSDGSRIFIDLPGDGNPHSHLLEMTYRFTNGRPARGDLALDFPRLGHDPWTRRLYWQLVLPRNEHMILPPSQLTSEFIWGWNGYCLGRQPLLEQPQLETWIGARHLAPVPESTSRYLFSGLGRIHGGELRTADRAWIVLVASAIVLIVGLAWIYVPATRHPLALLLLAVALIGGRRALSGTDAAHGPGGQLGPAAGAGGRGLAAEPVAAARPTYVEPSQVILDKGSTQPYAQPPGAGKKAATDSAAASVPSVTLDWNV